MAYQRMDRRICALTNQEILEAVRGLFGADIVKDAYAVDLKDYDPRCDIITADHINLGRMEIIVEFVNGRKGRIWSSESGGISSY